MNEINQIKPIENTQEEQIKQLNNIEINNKERINNGVESQKIIQLPTWSIEPPIEITRGE